MKSVATDMDIEASPERVWAVLTDLRAYGDWNPVVRRVRGEPRMGERLKFRIEIAGLPGLDLAARVCLADPARGFGWRGGPPGLFTGEHTMRIAPLGNGRTRLSHGEDFRGVLASVLLTRATLGKIERSYHQMNEALAKRVAAI